jgi:hypothetical protein
MEAFEEDCVRADDFVERPRLLSTMLECEYEVEYGFSVPWTHLSGWKLFVQKALRWVGGSRWVR